MTIVSSLWSWISGFLQMFGFHDKQGKLLFLGLDNAGKTTLLGLVQDGRLHQHAPTKYGSSVDLTIGRMRFTTYDLGGHKQARRVWKQYFAAVDGIVFIIDVTDMERLPEARAELESLLADEDIMDCPVAIFGNKIDKATVSEFDIRRYFGLYGRTTGQQYTPRGRLTSRPLELFMTSLVVKQGYGEGFRWLAYYLKTAT